MGIQLGAFDDWEVSATTKYSAIEECGGEWIRPAAAADSGIGTATAGRRAATSSGIVRFRVAYPS
jgi:hypothetical protein